MNKKMLLREVQDVAKPMVILVKNYRFDGNYALAVLQFDGTYWLDDCDVDTLENLKAEYTVIEIPDERAIRYLKGNPIHTKR